MNFRLSQMFQYAFCCNEEEDVRRIGTLVHVDDGEVHIVNIRCVFFCSSATLCAVVSSYVRKNMFNLNELGSHFSSF